MIVPLLRRALALLRAAVFAFAAACLVYMLVAVVVQVLGRYVFFFKIANAVETATIAQVWLAVMGAGIAMRRGTIFAIDTLPALLPLAAARALSVAMVAASLAFLGVVAYGSLHLIELGFFLSTPTLGIPMWIVYLPIPVGMAVFGLETVLRAAERWDNPFVQGAS